MITSFIKSAIRNIRVNKTNSFLNIFGLAIGISCTALIFLWVEDERNFDKNNEKRDRLYAVLSNQQFDAGTSTHWSTSGLLGPAIQQDIPGIANTCRKSEGSSTMLFNIGDKAVYSDGCYAEPSVFDMFTLPFVEGNATSAFKQLYSIVLTEKAAKKFFGNDKNIVGKTVRMDNKQDYIVSGVIKDIPKNSSLQFEWVAPFEIYFQESDWLHVWGNSSLTTYVELAPAAKAADVNNRIRDYIKKRVPGSIASLFIFGMPDWHLYGEFENGKQTGGGRITYVRMFSIIAWIILLIACINFMNLATARSEKRAREVGVRKVLGAGKRSLVYQFIGEALTMSLLAAVIAVVIVALVLPAFSLLVQKQLSIGLDNPSHLLALLLISLICGLVAGSYPSFYLSSFNPVFVLKGIKIKHGSAALIRKGLVVLQFSISIVLIISTIIIYQQIQHVKTRNLGFDKENLIEMNVRGEVGRSFSVIKHDLLQTGMVENVALSDHETIYDGNNTESFSWQGKPPGSKVLVSNRSITPEFFETSGIKLVEGRALYETDSLPLSSNPNITKVNVVITESLAKLMGTGSAVGKILSIEGDSSKRATVVGVVKDYVYGNMYGKPDPVVFICIPPQFTSVMYVKTKAGKNPEDVLSSLEKVMKKDNPAYPFDYRFVDEQFNWMFSNEMLLSKLSRLFAALAIIISCLGLFGLASYTAERRTKEIGIRKVLGASVTGIVSLLSRNFMQLILVSALIAFPVAWWIMHDWLQGFAYRIGISGWVFLIAGMTALFIAIATIGFQAIRAAVANPVTSLRSE